MHDEHEEITDTLELAHRINSSTDIVTAQEGTIDSQQHTIDQTIVQAKDEIIEAFAELTPGLVPIIEKIDQSTEEVMVGITGIAQKIDNIDFTPVEDKLEQIEGELMQGVTGLNQAVEEIKELVSGVTGYAQEDTLVQGIYSIESNANVNRDYILLGITGINQVTAKEETLVAGLSELSGELGQGFSGVEERIDQGFTGLVSAVQGITGYALDATVAKESTLGLGIREILQELAPKATQAQLESATAAIINAIPTDCAKQGTNAAATNTAILKAADTIDEKIDDISTDLSTVAREETLVQGVSGIIATINNIPEIVISNVAKQGDNPNVSLSSMDEKLGNIVLLTDEEFIEAIADLNTQLT